MGAEGPGLPGVRYLTVAEVAEHMRVSRMTVYRLVHSGEMPAVRVGRSFRVPESAVGEYLAGSWQHGGPGSPSAAVPERSHGTEQRRSTG